MGGVHQGPASARDNEREVARAELVRAVGRVVEAELGEEACFANTSRPTRTAPRGF